MAEVCARSLQLSFGQRDELVENPSLLCIVAVVAAPLVTAPLVPAPLVTAPLVPASIMGSPF